MVVTFYNYTNRMRTANDTPRIPVHAAKNTVDYRADVFLHQSKQYMVENIMNKKKC